MFFYDLPFSHFVGFCPSFVCLFYFIYLFSDTSFLTFLILCLYVSSINSMRLSFLSSYHFCFILNIIMFFLSLLICFYRSFGLFFIFLSLFPATSWTPPRKSSRRKTQASLTVQLHSFAHWPLWELWTNFCAVEGVFVYFMLRVWARNV
jgi:hypothetical protein